MLMLNELCMETLYRASSGTSKNAYMADATRCSKLGNPHNAILAAISQQVRAEVCKLEHCHTNFCVLQDVLHACQIAGE